MSNSNHKMNPFPGLRPFTQQEDYLFFGREEQTLELLARLGSQRFVAVVGASGSGKSSLVRCGLLSELQGGKMLGTGAAWEIAVTHPGGNPLALATEALLDAGLYDRAEEHSRENLLATLSRSHFGLIEAVKQAGLSPDTNFLLVVDQFEEIFRFHEAGQMQQDMANEFVSMLLEAVAQKDVPIYVVLTMRSDFIGECGQFEGLAEMVNRSEFLIPRLTREQYKRIIEGPIKVAGGQIAPRLLQRLLNDLGQQADQLPCLQHALMRTWNVWVEKGDQDALDLDDYQRVGKMTHALSLHADEIHDALATDRQRQLCRGLFQALTVQESESRGIRRPQRLGRLCQILNVPPDELLPIIDAYRAKGVTFLMPGQEVALSERTIIDISHESLMRVWTRLRNWVDEEAQAAGIYLRLSESAALYEQGKAGLYRDPELGIALAWQQSQHPNAAWAERYRPGFDAAMAFLAASQQAAVAEEEEHEAARQRELEQARQLAEAQKLRLEQQKRAARKLRKVIGVLAAVAVIAVLACVVALVARNEAGRLATVAEQEATNARHNEEKAKENAQRAEKSQKETADALAIAKTQKTKAEAAEQVARAAEEEGRKLLYTTDMRLAPFVWRDDRTTAEQLRALLAKHVPDEKEVSAAGPKPDLRGFEWHYYQHQLEHSATVFSGHAVHVVGGAFTGDGQVVTLDQNGQVRRWELGSPDENKASRLALPGGPGAQIRVLSPNGRLAALAEGNKVHVFDTATGEERFRIDSPNKQARRLIFSREGDRFVIADDKIRWLSSVSGEVIGSVAQKLNWSGEGLALSADGLTLAHVRHGDAGRYFSIFRLDATTRVVTPGASYLAGGGTLNASALSPDGQRIALGYLLSAGLSVYDTATGRLLAENRSAHASPITAIAFSGDGAQLATADAQGTIKVWAGAQKLTSKSTVLLTLKGHQGTVDTLGFSSDGKRLVSTGVDKTARLWDLDHAGAAIRQLERSGAGCFVARFSPNGQLIATADGSDLRLWDGATGGLVRELSAGDRSRIYSVAFSPADERLLAVGYGARQNSGQAGLSYVALWDIDAGMELARLPGATDLPGFQVNEMRGPVAALAFSPDGKYLAAGFGSKFWFGSDNYPNPLKVWEVATRRLIRRLNGHTFHCVSLNFSRDGTLLASGSRDGTAIIWSTATWKAMHRLPNPDRGSGSESYVDDAAFSPDGKTLALASRGGNVQLWDATSGRFVQSLEGHSSAVTAVAFSPDGRTLASGSGDQTVRLWNVATRRELMQLDPSGVELGPLYTLAFSPDGRQLLAGGASRTAFWSATPIIWNDPDRAAEKLRLLLQSNANFRSRIRMLSENLRLHEALEKLDAKDMRVQAALAATRANWYASQQQWIEAAKEVERLLAVDPTSPEAWLRTPGLLRLAAALLHRDRPADAALLLQGGAKRQNQDTANSRVTGLGMKYDIADGAVRIKELEPNSPASRSKLRPGDVIVKVNGIDTVNSTMPDVQKMLQGDVGTKVRLTVRHPDNKQTEDVELVAANYLVDEATGKLLFPLLAALDKRLAKDPKDAGLLELRAELAGEESDFARQAADCTAAIKILKEQPAEVVSAPLRRLYRRRGDAYVRLKKWSQAVDDYAHVVTAATTDEALLSNQALAQANLILEREPKPFAARVLTDPWQKLAAAYRLQGDQQAIDQLVQRRPQLAGKIGDLFTQGKDEDKDWQRAVEIYSRGMTAETTDAELLPKRAIAHEALKNWDAASADWSRAATGNPDGAKLLAEFGQRLVAAGHVPLAKAPFEKSQALYERALAADPDNDLIVPELAQLLWDKHENEAATAWTVLKPVEAKSELGATLSLLPDHSILASGANPANDRYRVVLTLGTDIDLKAVRLEALTHRSLPGNGPGRTPVGGFAQTAWNVTASSRDRKDPIRLLFDNVWADHEIPGYPMSSSGHWNIGGGGEGRDCTSIWSLPKPVSLTAGTSLTFEMQFKQWNDNRENLGRFRLSVSGNSAILDRERQRFAARKLTDPWAKLAVAYAVNGRNEEALQYLSRVLKQADGYEARKPILELAARFDRVVTALSKRPLDDPHLRLAVARNLAERGKQRLLEKQPAKAQAELEKSRELFTRLRAESQWTVLTATELKSQGSETLTVEKDGSIFVSGPNPNRAMYTLKLRTDLPTLTAIRLETIPDPRLPNGGAGRFDNGNFHVAEFTAAILSSQADAKPIPIEFGSAMADVSQNSQFGPAKSIDGDPKTRWDTLNPRGIREAHWAVFVLKSPVRIDGDSVSVSLDSGISEWGMHALGRFRLSATNDADLTRAVVRNDLKDTEVVGLCIALAKAHAQQSRTNEAVDSLTEALHLAGDRAGKAEIIAEAESLKGVLEKLTERAAEDGQFQVELARHHDARGHVQLADAARVKARVLFEQQLASRPDNPDVAHYLADLLLPETTRWIVLKPTDMRSQGGESFAVEDDGSIFVSGPNPQRAVYTLKFRPNLPTLTAIRLETIPDARLPNGGAGRSTENGNFHLAEFTAAIAAKTGRVSTPLVISRAMADHPESEKQISAVMIDGDPRTLWDTYLQKHQAHWALFNLKSPARMDGDFLSISLDSGITPWEQHGLGRFRLSVSDDPAAFEREQKRVAVRRLGDPWAKLAAAYHLVGDPAARDKLLARHPAATAGIGDLYALAQDWEHALAEYNKAITNGSKDARTFAARAEVYEKLEKWELAAADWGNADRHAIDKSERYGNPSYPYLERRTWIWSRLQEHEKIVLDCNELLKPERLGDNPWIFTKRGEAYDGLRQWHKARADYDRALKVCSPEERGSFHHYRARHFAAQGQWKKAAGDMQRVYQKPADFSSGSYPQREWWAVRDAALIFAVAGDVDNYGKAAADCYRKLSAGASNPDERKWAVLTMLLFPETITKENRSRLQELAGKTDAYWQPRLTAAIHCRSGHDKKAAGLFDANGGGPQFTFLAAMAYQRLGKHDRAEQLLEEGNSWVREQCAKDPGAGVPRPYSWHDWASVITLQYEASDLIRGPSIGPHKLPKRAVGEARYQAALARHFAARGNAKAADAAGARAYPLFAE